MYQFQDPYPRLVADERGPGYSARHGQTKSVPLGYIPQVPHTFAYHDADYGMVNEHQLAISESTSSSKFSAFAKGTEVSNRYTVQSPYLLISIRVVNHTIQGYHLQGYHLRFQFQFRCTLRSEIIAVALIVQVI